MADKLQMGKGFDRRLITDPPTPEYRLVGWHCIYHEQQGRMCHNPLDCDFVPTWALTVEAGLDRITSAYGVNRIISADGENGA